MTQFTFRAVRTEHGNVPADSRWPAGPPAATRVSTVEGPCSNGSRRRFDEALDILDRGAQSDPLLPTLAAAEVIVRRWQRDFDGAVRVGSQAVSLHPYLHVIRANYAEALLLAGRPAEALEHFRIAAVMSPDVPWLAALEGTCQATLGRLRHARAVLERLETARRRSQYVDAYFMAKLRLALGQAREALAELDRAYVENSAWMSALDVDPSFDTLRDDRAFRRLLRWRAQRRRAPARRSLDRSSRLTQMRRGA